MLRTLEGKGHESSLSKSVIKDLRNSFYQALKVPEDQISHLWPKKGKLAAFKVTSGLRKSYHIVIDKEVHFINTEHYIVPALKTVHAYPDIYPKFIADTGALNFLLKGANVMSPGLTNENSHMDEVEENSIVAVYCKGHEHALALGVTTKSTETIRSQNEGVAVLTIHFVGDGFWNMLYNT